MILFNAADSGSGVKGYAMRVGTSAWRDAANPQPVGKSIFSRTISVRAYDFAGNFQEESIHIPALFPRGSCGPFSSLYRLVFWAINC